MPVRDKTWLRIPSPGPAGSMPSRSRRGTCDKQAELPQAFKDNVGLVNAHNAQDSTYKMSCVGPFAAMDNAEYKKALGYKSRSLYGRPVSTCILDVHSGKPAAGSGLQECMLQN